MKTFDWAGLLALVEKYGPVMLAAIPEIIALFGAPPALKSFAAGAGPAVTVDDFRVACAREHCDPAEVEAAIEACTK